MVVERVHPLPVADGAGVAVVAVMMVAAEPGLFGLRGRVGEMDEEGAGGEDREAEAPVIDGGMMDR
jgi:hypothetical protein